MKFLTIITQFFKSLTSPYPMRDWYIALGVTTLVALTLTGLGVYLFIGIQSGSIIVPKSDGVITGSSFSRERLNTVVEMYSERAVNFDADNYPVSGATDPAR